MRVLIVSDTHRKNENFFQAVKEAGPVDMVIHCGDIEGSEQILSEYAKCPVEMVAGNNDYFSRLPMERELEIGGYRVWVTHGHNYYVSMSLEYLKREARLRGVDIVCFGHTHKPLLDSRDGVKVVNPGSLSYPRQDGRRPSYVLMEIDGTGEAHFEVRYLRQQNGL